jgi:3-oxoacyl-[acyl-carrier protein] reductase
MDLGIEGRRAIVCASSRGLGKACAMALAQEGVQVFVNGRDEAALAASVEEIRDTTGGTVNGVAADITTAAGRAALMDACPEADILVNNNAGPPPGDFEEIEESDWEAALGAHMVSPLLLIRAVLNGMRERHFGRIVNVTSAMVTTPRPHMTLSSGARAGLTAAVKGLSLKVAADNVTINNLLPERLDTDRQAFMAHRHVERNGGSYEEAREQMAESIAAKRFGRPEEFGATCAFLCSEHAGFISGMNVHLDGGSYPALV